MSLERHACEEQRAGWRGRKRYGVRARQRGRGPARGSRGILRLRVSIVDIEAEIWHTMDVDDSLTLVQLHMVLQAAFTWFDSYLHRFVGKGTGGCRPRYHCANADRAGCLGSPRSPTT